MEATTRESSNVPEQQSSFGIKKIVDCKIGEGGRQMYKVKWEPTWEPAENLASCQHLIDEFWSFVNKAKTNEEVAQQHRKRMRLDQQGSNNVNIDQNFDRMSEDSKAEVQRMIARANATSVGNPMLMSPSNMLMSPQRNQQNNLMGMARTPTHANNQNFPNSPQTPQNMMRQQNPAMQMQSPGQKSLNFGSPQPQQQQQNFAGGQQNFNSPGQKGNFGAFGNNKVKAPTPTPKSEPDETKDQINDSKLGDNPLSKSSSNSGLKYLENFDNPYVKITLACKVCSKEQSLKYPNTWKRHFLTHAAKEDLPHKCNYCEKAFVTSTNLKNHIKSHLKGSALAGAVKEEPWYHNTMEQY